MIATTPFELLFGEKAWLPSFPNEDIQKIHYSETSAAEQFNLLQKLRKIAHENAASNGQKTKEQYDKKVLPSFISNWCSSPMTLIQQKNQK
jgi:hypothetical protein